MTTGLDYNKPDASNNIIVQAVTDTFRQLKQLGSVYWPGLRTDDTYSLQTLTGDPARPAAPPPTSPCRPPRLGLGPDLSQP